MAQLRDLLVTGVARFVNGAYFGGASTFGSATRPIWWNNGFPQATTYSLSATLNAGSANRLAYYSGANAVSASSHYASATQVGINITNIDTIGSRALYVNGTSEFSDDIYANKSIRNLAVGGGLYWNSYVESTTDSSDAASITVIKSGIAGGTELQIKQANDQNDVINLVAPYYIYLNNKRAFTVNDTWLRINDTSTFTSGIYTGTSILRTDNQLQVGNNGANFYAKNTGDAFIQKTLGINGTDVGYALYVNGKSRFDNLLHFENGTGYTELTIESRRSKNSSNADIETITGLVTKNKSFIEIRGFAPPTMVRTTMDRPAPYGLGFGNGSESAGIMPVGDGDKLQELMFYGANTGPTLFTWKYQLWETTTYDSASSNGYSAAMMSLNSKTGDLYVKNTIGINGTDTNYKLYVNGKAKIGDGTTATSASTGALRVDGGIGVSGNSYFGGNVTATLFLGDASGHKLGYRHLDAGNPSSWSDSRLYIGYGALYPTRSIGFYNTNSDNTGNTLWAEINDNGFYAKTRFGVNGQNTSYNFYVNGTSYFVDKLYFPADTCIIQNQASTSNSTTVVKWLKGGASQNTYDPSISQHNTGGDGTGSITILPYATATSPWGGSVGLFVQKGKMLLDEKEVFTANSYSTLDARYVNVTGDTMTGLLNITTSNVTTTFGCQNSSYNHFSTTASVGHWFNKNVYVQGNIYAGSSYNKLVLTVENYDATLQSTYLKYNGWWTSGSGQSVNNASGMIFCYANHGVPTGWGILNTFTYQYNSSYKTQFYTQGYDCIPYIRTYSADRSAWTSWKRMWCAGDSVTSAVWNDYAECRKSDSQEPGYVMFEKGDDTLAKTIERLQHFAGIVSDTWGFSQGETADAKTNIAVAGRVLAYPYRDRNEYKPGDCVCAAPGGKVDIMTREEIAQYPDRIVGTVSCVPEYEEWGGGELADRDPVKVNGRIWIKVK